MRSGLQLVEMPTPFARGAFATQLVDRLTELRLAVDLGEITSPDGLRAILERGGLFEAGDPRVHQACAAAGLGQWLSTPSTA